MQLVFDQAGLKNEVTAPSVVNVFRVATLTAGKTGRFGKMNAYLTDYYAAGGSGRPNVHLYFDPHWAERPDTLGKILASQVDDLTRSIPDAYKRSALVGEFGVDERSDVAKCNAHAMDADSRATLYQQVVNNPTVKRDLQMILFWRLFSLKNLMKPADNCDQFFGMTTNDWPHAASPADALGTFTEAGQDLLKAAHSRR